MKLPKIKHSYTTYGDADFSQFGDDIVKDLTGNAYFPNVGPARDAFAAALKVFQDSIPAPSDKSTARTAQKNANKQAAIQQLTLLSYFVMFEAAFNLVALETTSFELANKPQPKGLVGTVKNLEIRTNGTTGMIIITCAKDDNASIYTARVSTDEVNWMWIRSSTTRTVKVMGLPLGAKLFVQMQLENVHGTSPWSQSKTGIILGADAIPSIHK